jgi:hypothetical protein
MDKPMCGTQAIPNYETRLPIHAGLIAGIAGALSIMVVVTGVLLVSGNDIWTAVRLIATFVYGPKAGADVAPIIVGTIIHLITGGALGAVFAALLPCLPRSIWFVAGLIYGLGAWLVSSFMILPLVAPLLVATDINIGVLLIAHVAYGFTLGLAGASYELLWRVPTWQRIAAVAIAKSIRLLGGRFGATRL